MSDMTFRELQQRQSKWVLNNFPEQVENVSSMNVYAVAIEAGDRGVSWTQGIADAINAGDKRLCSRRHHGLLGAVEELGELCHAFLKMEQGIRKGSDWTADAEDAVGDCIIFLASFCNTYGFDLQAIIEKTWAEVELRNWVEFPKNGRTE